MTRIRNRDHSDEVRTVLEEALTVALETMGLVAEGYAKRLCPVDTGLLRNSISHVAMANTAYIGTNVEYAAYVEMGTSSTRPQPYLKPAIQDHVAEYKRIVRDAFEG